MDGLQGKTLIRIDDLGGKPTILGNTQMLLRFESSNPYDWQTPWAPKHGGWLVGTVDVADVGKGRFWSAIRQRPESFSSWVEGPARVLRIGKTTLW